MNQLLDPTAPCRQVEARLLMRSAAGQGFSHSTTKHVLRAASDLYLEKSGRPSRQETLQRALRYERADAGGRHVAAQDAAAIVYGNACQTFTKAEGDVVAKIIDDVDDFVRQSVVWAYHPNGEKHSVPDLLQALLHNPAAPRHIAALSRLAEQAADGLRRRNIYQVAEAVENCREVFFEQWGRDRLIHPAAAEMAAQLKLHLGSDLLAWKPPGAGAAPSLILLTEQVQEAIEFLQLAGWQAFAAALSEGVTWSKTQRTVTISAPQRLDLVGAADLGQNLGIDGVCCGLAVEPRSELTLHFDEPRLSWRR